MLKSPKSSLLFRPIPKLTKPNHFVQSYALYTLDLRRAIRTPLSLSSKIIHSSIKTQLVKVLACLKKNYPASSSLKVQMPQLSSLCSLGRVTNDSTKALSRVPAEAPPAPEDIVGFEFELKTDSLKTRPRINLWLRLKGLH